MAEGKKRSDSQTHEEIVKPVSTRCVLKALDDAKAGGEVWRESFPDPDKEVWGPCKLR